MKLPALSGLLLLTLLTITACSQRTHDMTKRVMQPCGDKPNCVSTIDERQQFHLAPYQLVGDVSIEQIAKAALQIPRSKVVAQEDNYLHIECTSKILRFVDDLELEINGTTLVVRSESRVGRSDFGVNRKRADQLRAILLEYGLIAGN